MQTFGSSIQGPMLRTILLKLKPENESEFHCHIESEGESEVVCIRVSSKGHLFTKGIKCTSD